jgi:hypothetical protein
MGIGAERLAIEGELRELAGLIDDAEAEEARRLSWTMLGASPMGFLLLVVGITRDLAYVAIPLAAATFAWSAWRWRRADRRVLYLHALRSELQSRLLLLSSNEGAGAESDHSPRAHPGDPGDPRPRKPDGGPGS